MANIVKSFFILLALYAAVFFCSGKSAHAGYGETRIVCRTVKLYDDKLSPAEETSQSDKNLLNEIFRSATTFCRNKSETDSGSFKELLSPEYSGYPLCIQNNFFKTTEKFNVFLQEISIVAVSGRDGPRVQVSISNV